MTTQTNIVHRIGEQRALDFLTSETQGRIFSCFFEKKDGTIREMVCRRGVQKYRKGSELAYDAKAKRLVPVFDMQKKAYRMVNVKTLISFRVSGETFIVA